MTTRILIGECRQVLGTLPAESVHCVVTSPPYFGLRDYGMPGQIGLESTPENYVHALSLVFDEISRVLRSDGTVWLNLGDSYAGGGHGGGGSFESERNWRKGAVPGEGGQQGGSRNRDGLGRVTGAKPKDLLGMPWRVAFNLQANGWYLRQDIIWSKPNPMPESVRDRCTKAHEYLFMLSKSEKYHYDQDAIAEPASESSHGGQKANPGTKAQTTGNHSGSLGLTPRQRDKQRGHGRRHAGFNDRWDAMERAEQCSGTRNKRSVWTIGTQPFAEAHFATFPPGLIEPCILAGCPKGGTVLDPFGGAGTTGLVADRLGRNAILIELNPEYADMAERRIRKDAGLFADVNP